jgi:hypothetical protein
MAALANAPTTTRLLLVNTSVLLIVFIFLALTPAPVTFPESSWETALLVKGGLLLLAANIAAARLGTASKLARGPRPNTSSEPLVRMREYEHHHVLAPEGVIGIVDEVIGDRDGEPVGLLVVDGWFGARRCFVSLDDVRQIDQIGRTISISDSPARTGSPRTVDLQGGD